MAATTWKNGLIQGLDTAATSELHVNTIVTDWHPQIMKYLLEEMPSTEHKVDVWHVVKGTKPVTQ